MAAFVVKSLVAVLLANVSGSMFLEQPVRLVMQVAVTGAVRVLVPIVSCVVAGADADKNLEFSRGCAGHEAHTSRDGVRALQQTSLD